VWRYPTWPATILARRAKASARPQPDYWYVIYGVAFIMLETIISNKFKLISKLGINPFYEVFKGIHLKNQTTVAIKI
jgi:hypothetical protein